MTNTNVIRQIRERYEGIERSLTPDAVLQTYMLDAKFSDVGTAEKLFKIYETTHDKKAFKEMFETFTGKKFNDYLRVFVADNNYRDED